MQSLLFCIFPRIDVSTDLIGYMIFILNNMPVWRWNPVSYVVNGSDSVWEQKLTELMIGGYERCAPSKCLLLSEAAPPHSHGNEPSYICSTCPLGAALRGTDSAIARPSVPLTSCNGSSWITHKKTNSPVASGSGWVKLQQHGPHP